MRGAAITAEREDDIGEEDRKGEMPGRGYGVPCAMRKGATGEDRSEVEGTVSCEDDVEESALCEPSEPCEPCRCGERRRSGGRRGGRSGGRRGGALVGAVTWGSVPQDGRGASRCCRGLSLQAGSVELGG